MEMAPPPASALADCKGDTPMDQGAGTECSAAGGGADEGVRDEGEEWRKGLAATWGQSSSESGSLRSQYAVLRGIIREMKDGHDLGPFDATMGNINELHEKVQRPIEQLIDGEAMLDLADVLVVATKLESRDGPTPSEFVTALLRKYGVRPSPLDDSNESFSWSTLGAAVSSLFMAASGCQTMNGPMGLAVKERTRVVRKQSERLDGRPAEPDELAKEQDQRNDTDENMDVMFRLLRSNKSVKLEHLILNRWSFAQTVENIFALSFLVKDGRAEIDLDDNGNHFVKPRNAPVAELIVSREVINRQFVFRFDTEDWKIMQDFVEPGEELMPHRNSYHGGEYKSTQPCSAHDCSKLGSNSKQPKEGREFIKEAGVEFRKEEAMEENLANWRSGDDTLKKRKRQHVARRLFSAND